MQRPAGSRRSRKSAACAWSRMLEARHEPAEGGIIDTLNAARADSADVVKLIRELVRIPSRGGIDSYDPVLDTMAAWLAGHGLTCRKLAGPDGTVVALTCE